MGEDLPDLNIQMPHSLQQHLKSGDAMKNISSNSRHLENPSLLFPSNMSPYGHTTPSPRTMPPGLVAANFNQLISAINFPNPDLLTEPASQRQFLVFDQSGDRTSLIFSSINSPVWDLKPTIPKQKLEVPSGFYQDLQTKSSPVNQSDVANISDGNGGDDMHEDTEEIDALLYSDSEDEEETSTDRSPLAIAAIDEMVASSGVPTKRKRWDEVIDSALVDTASSAVRPHLSKDAYNNDKCSCIKASAHDVGTEMDVSRTSGPNKRLKRDRIRQALGVLRRIVPGGKGKDTTAVLDEAIEYLRSFKLKSKLSGAALVQWQQ